MSKRHMWALFCLAIFTVACALVLPGTAHADAPNSLTVHFEHDQTKVSNVATRVYLVAKKDAATDSYTYVDAFSGSGVDLATAEESGKASDWDGAANKLDSYVTSQSIKPVQTGTSNGMGDVTFSNLEDGLYLVVSDPAQIGNGTYEFSSYLIALPKTDKSGAVTHTVTSAPKSSVYEPTKPPTPTSPKPNPPTPPTPEKLAQTGDTWLPVLPFVVGGLLLVAIGWKLHNDARRDQAKG